MKRSVKHIAVIMAVLACTAGASVALAEEKSGFDQAWGYMTLYKNEENNTIQKLAFTGRLQLDAVWVSPENVDNWNDVDWRRFRAGFKLDFLQHGVAHIEANFGLNEEPEDWYTQLTDAYIQWTPSKDMKFKVLKQSAGFTLDGATSSKNLLTLERNNLTNNLWFTSEYFNGALVSGRLGEDWSYKASIFSSGGDPELDWDGASWFTLWSLGYKLGNTKLRADYVYQDEDPKANTRDFEQVLSLNAQWQDGSWGARGDVAFGKGFADQGQDDVWGVYLMPYYNTGKHTQIVLAYTYVEGDGQNSVRLNRYEGRALDASDAGGRGDRYNEIYGGFNVYFYDHKFKWQTGLSYANMEDSVEDGGEFKGWTLNTGLRVYW